MWHTSAQRIGTGGLQDGGLQDGRLQDGRLQDGRLQDGRLQLGPACLATDEQLGHNGQRGMAHCVRATILRCHSVQL